MRIAFSVFIFFCSFIFVQHQATAQVNLPGGLKMPGGGGGGGGGLGSGGGGGAVLDDSTKNIYGPKTTLHYFENDILNNRDSVRYLVDTALTNFHRWSPIDRSWGKLVDLGNAVTASRNLFFQPRQDIGTQLGMRAYDAYAIKQEEVQYIDTKSQHTYLSYINGGKKTSLGKFGYSQNVHSRLNFGLNFERFTSNKQYGIYNTLSSEAFLGQNWTFLLHGSYFSKDKKYLILANYRHLNQKVREQGGVVIATDESTGITSPYPYDGPARISDNANSWERRHVFHIYQQYKLANGFQLFQQGDFTSIINRYTDLDITRGVEYMVYKDVNFDESYTRQDIYHKVLDTKLGVKGYYSGFNYRAYFRPRLYSMTAGGQVPNTTGSPYASYRTGLRFDNIVGGWAGYYLKDSAQHLTVEAELNLSDNVESNLKGELKTKWGLAGAQYIRTAPDLIVRRYLGNHFDWRNNFSTQNALTIYGSLPLKTKRIDFVPEVHIHNIENYIYYDTLALPKQLSSAFNIYRVGFTTESHFKRWNFAGMAYYSATGNSDVFKVPNIFGSGEVTFDFIYAKVLYIQLGLAARYRSTYYADAYMPVTQQFHRQNTTQLQGRVVTDAFANVRISRVRLFFQMSYLNMKLWGAAPEGYYVTPGYMGQGRAFSFGVLWPLFD
ncbi:putative porin [Dyadobacter sp. CY312]|uniref:putative porin n=1 Tax=Dyadobacter sp. CY312 TaxID=2907303 RepID=UPI001F24BCD1|nr:putative porin [Dyadobacter sp. CY312]MCE7042395.1 putative porin [Dyadobacter sp. CY312]